MSQQPQSINLSEALDNLINQQQEQLNMFRFLIKKVISQEATINKLYGQLTEETDPGESEPGELSEDE